MAPTIKMTPPEPVAKNNIDPILFLLFAGMILCGLGVLWVDHFFPSDGQVFQVFSNLLAGFSGAFFMRVNPHRTDDKKES